MTTRKLPEVKAFQRPKGLEIAAPTADTLARWEMGVRAADQDTDTTISIYDQIGEDSWTGGGTTAKRIAAALRTIGKRDVVVNINSPGGDLFEGLAIYNLLRAHDAKVTVRVMGLAASAASFIAMAGDVIQVARAGFFMVHNAWVVAMGNRHDMREVADWLEPFDAAMADVYMARTGLEGKVATKLMDAETWIGGQEALDLGFADEFLPADLVGESAAAKAEAKTILAVKQVEAILAKNGISRNERRSLIAGIKGVQLDADPNTQLDAGAMRGAFASLNELANKISK